MRTNKFVISVITMAIMLSLTACNDNKNINVSLIDTQSETVSESSNSEINL